VCCQLGLGLIFIISASGKFANPRGFLRAVAEYRLLSDPFVALVAASLPGVELLTGLLLVIGLAAGWRVLRLYARAAALVAALMLVAFIIVLSINLLRGIDMDCGCFDLLGDYIPFFKSSRATWWTVLRDVVMLVLTVPVLIGKEDKP
jgi:uncharacterized membrane protein YphA (DoxX/SURF4 family)